MATDAEQPGGESVTVGGPVRLWWGMAIATSIALLGVVALLTFYESHAHGGAGYFKTLERIPESANVVRCGAYVLDVSQPDMRSRSFSIDLYLWLAHPVKTKSLPSDASAAENAERPPGEHETDPLLKFELMNGDLERVEETIREIDGDDIVATWRVKATCRGDFLFTRYPFDKQVLRFAIEHPDYDVDTVVFVPDSAPGLPAGSDAAAASLPYLEPDLKIPSWKIVRTELRPLVHHYTTNFGMRHTGPPTASYSRLELNVEVNRDCLPFVVKILVPLILVMSIAYLVAFLHHQELEASAGIILTCLLSTIALHLSEASNLGEAGYLITMDKFFIFNYLCLLALFAETVATHVCFQVSQQVAFADFMDQATRWLFPPVYLAGVGIIMGTAIT
ncbi:MAG: hypothetical protein HYU36_02735 [Planctomycetes bacterium]|nr:hypothetical protein [Planctomycetota bacterium]